MSSRENLYDFEAAEPPLVAVFTQVSNPEDPSKTAGFLGTDPARGVVYVSPRKRDEHYFRKFEGYGISTSLLSPLVANKAYTVLVAEDNETLYEFDVGQFRNAERYHHADHDEQAIVPVEEAKHVWTAEEAFIR